MFHSRTSNNRINKIQERSLRLVCNDSSSSFRELIEKDNSFTIHHRNIQKLTVEIHKVKHHEAPKIMRELFSHVNLSYDLPKDTKFRSYNVKTVHYGTETLSYFGSKIWNFVPPKIKNPETSEIIREKIKRWKPDSPIDAHIASAKR